MNKGGSLWIGGLEEYMTEDFLRNSMSLMGEEDSLVLVKRIRNKYNNALATYGFLTFESDASALMAMHKLNGKIIPNSQPPVRFQLNHASAKQSGGMYSEREYSIWVSDLPDDITDEDFRKTFSTRYESVVSAKLVREKAGRGESEKVYGFVRFSDMNDQREALIHMNGFVGIHGHPGEPIKVSMAVPKQSLSEASKLAEKQSAQYSHMYENYWSDKDAWGNYGTYQGNSSQSSQTAPTLTTARYYAGRAPARPVIAAHGTDNSIDWDLLGIDSEDGDSDLDDEKKAEKELAENRLIEYDSPINVDAMNAEFIARSQEVWDAVERDRWIYNLENDDGIAPNFNKNRGYRSKPKIDNQNRSNGKLKESVTDHTNAPDQADDGFGPDPSSTNEEDIPNLMDIPLSEFDQ